MPTSEKEINNYLFDQLSVVERLSDAYKEGKFEQEKEKILREIKRKLYQKLPLVDENE